MESIPYYILIITNNYHKNPHISQNRNHAKTVECVVPCISKKQKCNDRKFSNDSLVSFCENTDANAVLRYFAQQAKDNCIDYFVKVKIPNDIFVSDTDISVMFGNLIENALESCRNESGNDRKILIRASLTGNSFCITVDNTFSGTLKYTNDDKFVSTKHKGLGLGTQSVKSIAANYNGVCRFETKDGMFYASVMCNKTDS